MLTKEKVRLSLFINVTICLNVILYTFLSAFSSPTITRDAFDPVGIVIFRYFTTDSNILCGVICGILAVFEARFLLKGRIIPRWIISLKQAASVGVFLTFVTVVFFLAPVNALTVSGDYFYLFKGSMKFYHFLNGVLATISLILLETKYRFSKIQILIGMIPMIIYSVFYFLFVVVFKSWPDFYGFTFGGHNWLIPIVFVVMYAAVFLISLFICKLHNKRIKE